MSSLLVEFRDPNARIWQNLSPAARQLLAEKALNAILEGVPFPTGPDQLELAIDLAEAGIDAESISRLSQLDVSTFQAFMKK
jgi:hypothetical protein